MKFFSVKKILSVALAATLTAGAFAVDFGGALRNATKFKGKDFSNIKLDQVDDLNLWLKIPFSKDGKIYFIAEGLYEFEYDDSVSQVYNRLDLNLLKFSASFKAKDATMNVSAGRFAFTDLTGLIFNQNADGLAFSCDASAMSFSLYGAYTGLLNANLVKMLDNPNDISSFDKKAVYELAQKYAVAAATFSLPRLAKRQSLSAQVLGTFKVDGKSFNRIYASLAFGGPIYKTLYYSLSSTLEMQSFDGSSMDLSNLSAAKLTWFLPFKDLALNLGGLYASGSAGPFEAFSGFTKLDAYNALSEPQHTGLAKGSFSASMKPVKSVLLNAGCDVILDAATSSLKYKGFQYNLGADWQIFSDLKAGLAFLQYFDDKNKDLNKVQISLNAAITF